MLTEFNHNENNVPLDFFLGALAFLAPHPALTNAVSSPRPNRPIYPLQLMLRTPYCLGRGTESIQTTVAPSPSWCLRSRGQSSGVRSSGDRKTISAVVIRFLNLTLAIKKATGISQIQSYSYENNKQVLTGYMAVSRKSVVFRTNNNAAGEITSINPLESGASRI
jgi:uncharacterized protein YggE